MPLDEFWKHRGYSQRPDLVATFSWRDIGERDESEKPMIYWMKTLVKPPHENCSGAISHFALCQFQGTGRPMPAIGWSERRARRHLLVFPEYGGMELTSLLPEALQQDLRGQIPALEKFHADFVATYAALAAKHGVFIQAPSLPVTSRRQVSQPRLFFLALRQDGFPGKAADDAL